MGIASKLTLRVGEADGKGDGLGLTLADISSGVPDPAAVGADVGGELHVGDDWYRITSASWFQTRTPYNTAVPDEDLEQHTVVVGADLEGLVAAHDKAGLAVLLVLE